LGNVALDIWLYGCRPQGGSLNIAIDIFATPSSTIELILAIFGVAGAAVATIIAWTSKVNRSEGNIEALKTALDTHINRGYALETEMRGIADCIRKDIEDLRERIRLVEYRIDKLDNNNNK
jgi:hypothetical protein